MNTPESYVPTAALAAGLLDVQTAPRDAGKVIQIIVRPDRDLRELPGECELTPAEGMRGDRWVRHCTRRLSDGTLNPDTQLTLMNVRLLELLTPDTARWPLAGDNLLVDLDLSHANLPVGQRLRIGEAVVEITVEPHTGCAKFSKRFGPDALKFVNSTEGKALRLRGVNAQVVTAGRVKLGDLITKV